MKPKPLLILLLVFLALLAAVLFLDRKDGGGAESGDKLVEVVVADVESLLLKQPGRSMEFRRGEAGEWSLAAPIEAPADSYEVSSLVEAFADLRIERVVEPEGADFAAFEIPKSEVILRVKGQERPVAIQIGMENPIDQSLFARREGDPRLVLLPSHLKSRLEKTSFDYRKKDVFRFETGEVGMIRVSSKGAAWEARRKDGEWFLEAPVRALARESKIENLLQSLAGVRAKEFVSETKSPEDLKKAGLDEPALRISLGFPATGREIAFLVRKTGETTHVATSDSTKILAAEADLAAELDHPAGDYREGKITAFNAWQAAGIVIRTEDFELGAAKDDEGKWRFDSDPRDEADASKIETFIRRIESLEAAEFIDQPKALSGYGLDPARARIAIRTKDTGEPPIEKSFIVLIGEKDKDGKVVLKNDRLDYLFRLDAAFLDDFPKERKDWAVADPEKT